ncbi:Fpg/Nei family DNA glycosylase [Arthrobacter castelli]|uniref:Fpg/Nei family DNA glycosylase n=1 Tax=Arthrobacter castelli TaxID=271431 RepID=UPI00040FE2E9|nr:DNA-formamidopyrimidine glycosylase family protein [Arthrobacter castelli]
MPEGDTVSATANRLHRALAGRELIRSDFRVPRYATVDLSGSTVTEVVARGKHLLVRIDADTPVTVHSHLKMEGTWHVYRPGQKWRRPAFTARVVLTTPDSVAVGYSLGILDVIPTASEPGAVGRLGPDLLGPDWDLHEALRRLLRNPDRAIGLALLDQRNLAGIGNIHRNEACFLARVHPGTAVSEVPRLERMVATARRLLQVNRDRKLRTAAGAASAGSGLWVHRRHGRPCHRCGTLVRRGRLGDPTTAARDIYYCPFCQRPGNQDVLDTSGIE